MATISKSAQTAPVNMEVFLWETLTENDTAEAHEPSGVSGLFGSVQFIGTFGGATLVLQGSNDGTNWVTLNDKDGNAISTAAAGAYDFSTAMRYVRPSPSGGTGQDVDVYMVLRTQ